MNIVGERSRGSIIRLKSHAQIMTANTSIIIDINSSCFLNLSRNAEAIIEDTRKTEEVIAK